MNQVRRKKYSHNKFTGQLKKSKKDVDSFVREHYLCYATTDYRVLRSERVERFVVKMHNHCRLHYNRYQIKD